jgi:hypothetical protein
MMIFLFCETGAGAEGFMLALVMFSLRGESLPQEGKNCNTIKKKVQQNYKNQGKSHSARWKKKTDTLVNYSRTLGIVAMPRTG